MPATMKIKLRRGNREVEIEGTREDVEALLQQYWVKNIEPDDDDDDGIAPKENGPKQKKRRRRAADTGSAGDDGSPTIDHAKLANKIKQHSEFARIDKKVLHNGGRWEKLAAVLWALDDEPDFYTSGDLVKVLHKLGSKEPLNRVSETVSRKKKSLLEEKRGDGKTGYRLERTAKSEFENWFRSESKELAEDEDDE